MTDPAPSAIVAFDWLVALYSEFEDGWLSMFSLDGAGARYVDWLPVADLDGAADRAATRAEHGDVWLGVATRRERLPKGRGGDDDCVQFPGLWLDVDIAGPGHKGGHTLPEDEAGAWALIADYPRAPSYVVHSGGGLQAWWLFDEPVDAADIAPVLPRWNATWKAYGERHGWHVDNVFDLARIMRLPGTLNRKTDQPRPVRIVADNAATYGLSDLDELLIDPPAPEAPPVPARAPLDDPDLPGAVFNAQRTAGDVLAGAGWTLGKTDRNGDQHWTRPGKDPRQGSSATVYADDGHTTVYSDTVAAEHPSIELRRPYDPFGLYTHLRHGGDWSASSEALAELGYGRRAERRDDDWSWLGLDDPEAKAAAAPPPEEDDDPDAAPGSSWRATGLADLYDGIVSGTIDRPKPTVGRFADVDRALYYPGRVNGLYGESGLGKSWIALALAAEVLGDGGVVAWIDLEEPAEGILSRLIDLGVERDAIVERLLHFAPEESIRLGGAMFAELDLRPPTLAVIDSTGEALTLEGAGPNNDDEVAAWFRLWPRRIAKRYGTCVVVIDHVIKDEQTRGLFPGGSQRKRAAITGSAFMADGLRKDALGKDVIGTLTLTTAKDRHGTHRRAEAAARFTLNGTVTPQRWELATPAPPPSERDLLAPVMEAISDHLAERDGQMASKSEVERNVSGKSDRKRAALDALVEEGYVERFTAGQTLMHRLLKPFSSRSDGLRQMCGP